MTWTEVDKEPEVHAPTFPAGTNKLGLLNPLSHRPVDSAANFAQAPREAKRNTERDYHDIEYSKIEANNEWMTLMDAFKSRLTHKGHVKGGEKNFLYVQMITSDPAYITEYFGAAGKEQARQIRLPENISNTVPGAIFFNVIKGRSHYKFLDHNDHLVEYVDRENTNIRDFISNKIKPSPEYKKYFNTVISVRKILEAEGDDLSWVSDAMSQYARTAFFRAQTLKQTSEFSKASDLSQQTPPQIYNVWQGQNDPRFSRANPLARVVV